MATVTNMGYKLEILNVAVTDAAYVAVTPSSRTNNILLRAREDMYFTVKINSTDTNYFTVPSGQSLTIEVGVRNDEPVCYVQAEPTKSGTIEVLSMNES